MQKLVVVSDTVCTHAAGLNREEYCQHVVQFIHGRNWSQGTDSVG